MDRRHFLTASCALGATPLGALAASAGGSSPRQILEWREYHLSPGAGKKAVEQFYKEVGIAAMNRHGVGPVGVFSALFGPSKPTLYVLLPHRSLESVVTLTDRLLGDDEYRAGADYVESSFDQPAFLRVESSLMAAFTHMPQVEPSPLAGEGKPRVYEYRVYESHNALTGQKKVEMFNEGGEIAIFRKTGLRPVFFGQTLVGSRMPNLAYMLTFADMAERENAWAAFRSDPAWDALKRKPEYANTVSNISDYVLRPAPFSQV